MPSVRVDEEADSLVVVAEIPGAELDELRVTVLTNAVRIVGERKPEGERRQNGVQPGAYCLSRFTREVRITRCVDTRGVDAEFVNGTLTVRLPVAASPVSGDTPKGAEKAEESEGTTIKVH